MELRDLYQKIELPLEMVEKLIQLEKEISFTDVLLLYNMNTIDNDLGIGGIY